VNEGPLNPTQHDVLERIRVPNEDRPSYRSTLKIDLRHDLERELVGVADKLDKMLFVSKRRLAAVHGCEAHHLAEEAAPFEWSVPLARGTVSHKAIELSMHLTGTREPTDLVDEAVATLIDRQTSVGDFLTTCGEASRAELRSETSAMVASFLDTFPPLKKGWRPSTEVSKRVELCNDKITLSGKFDLTIGKPNDTTAGRVIVDVKTGGFAPDHREDLRFYALIETLVTGVPPLLVATHYVESGRLHEETITESVLQSAVRRTTDGIVRLSQLDSGDVEPVRKPGPACRWCPVSADCTPGSTWLSDADGW
jgi:hypothetical protein